MFRTAGSNRPVTPRAAARAPPPPASPSSSDSSRSPSPTRTTAFYDPFAANGRDFGLSLPATASRDAYRNAVANFPGMAARRPTASGEPQSFAALEEALGLCGYGNSRHHEQQ